MDIGTKTITFGIHFFKIKNTEVYIVRYLSPKGAIERYNKMRNIGLSPKEYYPFIDVEEPCLHIPTVPKQYMEYILRDKAIHRTDVQPGCGSFGPYEFPEGLQPEQWEKDYPAYQEKQHKFWLEMMRKHSCENHQQASLF